MNPNGHKLTAYVRKHPVKGKVYGEEVERRYGAVLAVLAVTVTITLWVGILRGCVNAI